MFSQSVVRFSLDALIEGIPPGAKSQHCLMMQFWMPPTEAADSKLLGINAGQRLPILAFTLQVAVICQRHGTTCGWF
jgi:hypothetical protein